MKTNSIGFIGGGRITQIFLSALYANQKLNQKIVVSDLDVKCLEKIEKNFLKVETTNQNKIVSQQDVVIIALHPPIIPSVLNEIRNIIKKKTIIISLAPKITINYLSEKLNSHKNIVRSIPNSPSIIQRGFNPLCFYQDFEVEMKKVVFNIFNYLGEYFETKENNLEAYAIITAMGPTYLQFQLNKLMTLANEFGLNEKESKLALKNMVGGVNSLLFESNLRYDQIEDLIPVKPIQENEKTICDIYDNKLKPLFEKLTS